MNLTASTTSLLIGATAQLTASVASTYTSSDTSILTVDTAGLVTAVAAGSATITATSTADANDKATVDFTVAALAVTPAQADTPTEQTPLEKLEGLLEKLEIEVSKEVKAAIAYVKALA
ncbi:hypothetical protein HAQ04_25630 [Pseudomonas sp. C2L11]|nr:hypothetical protein [Pseudomonas typographi]